MSEINCNACQELKNTSPNFVENGITDTECASLAADTGLNPKLSPKHTDAEDLHDMNDCLIGRIPNDLEKFNVCDWQDFMNIFIPNVYETIKGIICAIGGIWNFIHSLVARVSNLESRMTSAESRITTLANTVAGHTTQIGNINNRIDEIIAAMGGSDTVIPVTRHYRFTVSADRFLHMWKTDNGSWYNTATQSWVSASGGIMEWFSGANTTGGEMWIKIPLEEMDSISGVWAQTWVVPSGNPFDGVGKAFMQSVNIQQWYEEDGYLNVNFDTYILAPQKTNDQNGGPYPVTIDFLVVGQKTITTQG